MSDNLNLKYYHGDEPDNLCFYRIPKVLFTKACFEEVSTDAKVLYGLLLDHASLSRENRWVDENNRVYIFYSVQRVCAYMGCKKDKAMKMLSELDTFGLIERVKRGQGKSDIIYVKSFEVSNEAEDREVIKKFNKGITSDMKVVEKTDRSENPATKSENGAVGENDRSEISAASEKNEEVGKTEWSENPATSGEKKAVENTDRLENPTALDGEKVIEKTDRSEISTSSGRKNRLLEVGNSDPNNTDYNNTEMNNNLHPINLSWEGRISIKDKIAEKERLMRMDRTDETASLIALIKKNIEYDDHMRYDDYNDRELYDEMYQLICETVCVKKGTVPIEGQDYPQEIVKSRFLKLNSDHLEYVRDRMKQITSKIGNIKKYLLTALYNAPATISHFYQQEVQHDMYGSGDFYESESVKKLYEKYGEVIGQ